MIEDHEQRRLFSNSEPSISVPTEAIMDPAAWDTKGIDAIARLRTQSPKECATTILNHQLKLDEVTQVLRDRDLRKETFHELTTLATQNDLTLDFFFNNTTNSNLVNALSQPHVLLKYRVTYACLSTLLSSEDLHNAMTRLRVYRKVNSIPRAQLAFLKCPENVDLSPLKYVTDDIPSASTSERGDDENYSISPPRSPVPEEVKQNLRRRKIINSLTSTEMSLRVVRILKYKINEVEMRGSINDEAEVQNTMNCFVAYVKNKAKANECKREALDFIKVSIDLDKIGFAKHESREERPKVTAMEIKALTTLDEARDLLFRISNLNAEEKTPRKVVVPAVVTNPTPIATGLRCDGMSYRIPGGFYFVKDAYAFFLTRSLPFAIPPCLPEPKFDLQRETARLAYITAFPAGTIIEAARPASGRQVGAIAMARVYKSSKGKALLAFYDNAGNGCKKSFVLPWFTESQQSAMAEEKMKQFDIALKERRAEFHHYVEQWTRDRRAWEWSMFVLARKHIDEVHWSTSATRTRIMMATKEDVLGEAKKDKLPKSIRGWNIK